MISIQKYKVRFGPFFRTGFVFWTMFKWTEINQYVFFGGGSTKNWGCRSAEFFVHFNLNKSFLIHPFINMVQIEKFMQKKWTIPKPIIQKHIIFNKWTHTLTTNKPSIQSYSTEAYLLCITQRIKWSSCLT